MGMVQLCLIRSIRQGMMDNFDFTWKNAGEAQSAALDHTMRRAGPWLELRNKQKSGDEWTPPLNEFMIAEMMCIAEHSLWFTQAKGWANGDGFPAQGADPVWQKAGETIVALVEQGYKDGEWWNMLQLWSPADAAVRAAILLDIVRMLRVVRNKSLAIYSQWFEAIPYLVLPIGFKIEKAVRALNKESEAGRILIALAASFRKDKAKEEDSKNG